MAVREIGDHKYPIRAIREVNFFVSFLFALTIFPPYSSGADGSLTSHAIAAPIASGGALGKAVYSLSFCFALWRSVTTCGVNVVGDYPVFTVFNH